MNSRKKQKISTDKHKKTHQFCVTLLIAVMDGSMLFKYIKTRGTEEKSKQNITRDIEVKNNLTIARGEWGGDSEERGFQELL